MVPKWWSNIDDNVLRYVSCLSHGLRLAICDTIFKNQIISATINSEISMDNNNTDSDGENFENYNDIGSNLTL